MSSYGERGERGRFSGRGPKGWQRSDDRIREDVSERLADHPHIDASEIEINVNNGEITLTGTVEDRQSKRLAEDIAESVSGVREVHNQIRVQQRQGQQQDQFSNAGSTSTTDRKK
jgi:osmotically-inducible protein OsmY